MRKLAILLFNIILSSNLWASSVGHMGRLVDNSGTPLSGTATLRFEVHYSNDLTSTGLLCSIDMADVPLNNGIYNANLDFSSLLASGPNCNLNDLLKNTPAAETLVIRVKETNLGLTFDWQNILHVPAALRSEVAETAESVLDGAITAPKLNQMGASNNQVLTWTGAAWVPADLPEGNAGTVTSVGAGDGLSSGGTAADPVLNVNVDGTSMEIATDALQVKDLGITTAKLSANAVTPAKMGLNTNQFDPLAPVLSLILDPNGAIGSGISGLGILTNPSFLEITSNQLSLANSGVTPGTYTSLTVDAKGRVTSAGSVSSSDLPFIESLETACANGEIYVANTGLVSCQRHLDFIRIGSATNYVELRVPGAHTGTSVLTFPSTGGAANQVLTTDGTGVLSWQSPATSATPSGAAGGDLAGTYPNPTIAAGAVTYAKTNFADGDIPQVKINGLTTSLAGKENTITAGTAAQYWRGDKAWQTLNTTAVPEGLNLYFLESRVRNTILDGYLIGADAAIAPTDTLMQAIAKLEAQIQADAASATNGTVTSITAGGGLTGGTITTSGTIALGSVGTAGTYGSATQVPVLTTDAYGRVTGVTNTTITGVAPGGAAGGDLAGTYPNPTIATGAVTYAKTNFLDGDIPQAKVNGLTTSLAGKEATIAAGTTAQYWRGDKSWQTLNTTAVPEGTNLYYTTARARADAVVDAIVDGVLNIAPSQNAVFDALATKADSTSLTNYVAISGSNMTGPLGLNAQNQVQFRDGDSSNYVALRAPLSVAANIVFNLPAADGSAGQVLSTDGLGNMSWTSSGAGSVTNVTATLPLASTGGTTPNLSMTQANTTTNGFLSSTDWNTFNNKEPAVAAGTTAQYRRGDKTWQTLNTSIVPEGTNLYYTTARARADAVADTIVDGVLNVAPSQNAVFDALALKANASSLSDYVLKAGDTMTGALNLPANGLAVGTNQLVTVGGNVGIGTAAPSKNLHINDGSGEEGNPGVFIQDPTATSAYGGAFTFDDRGGANFIKMTAIDNNVETGFIGVDRMTGNVGVGTTRPVGKLDVRGPAHVGLGGVTDDQWGTFKVEKINATENYASMGFTTGTEPDSANNQDKALVILRKGNVGIGTTTPKEKLDVAGNARLNGLPMGSFNPFTGFAVSNQDYTHFIEPQSGTFTYSEADGGILTTGATWFFVRTRLPVDENAIYRASIRIEKLSGDGTVYLGANSLDSNFNTLQTDQANSYNYFAASNQTVALGTEQTFTGIISGFNTTTEGSRNKFDPGARYFDLVVITNYTGSGQSVVKSIEVEKLPIRESWQPVSYQNGWVDYGSGYNPAGYTIDKSGFVRLRGMIKTGTTGVCAFTLPPGYRPENRELLSSFASGNIAARVDVTSDGCVTVMVGSSAWTTLDGLYFRAYR